MGKPTGKKKNPGTATPPASPRTTGDMRQTKSSKAFDEDTAIFINMSQELKEEGNKLFQRRDHEGAMLKYEKALKLLPRNHIDVAYLRTNMAACYMQMGLGLGFKVDEIVQAWNEMYDAKRWEIGVPSFRLEPLFRRRVPKLHDMLEQV